MVYMMEWHNNHSIMLFSNTVIFENVKLAITIMRTYSNFYLCHNI